MLSAKSEKLNGFLKNPFSEMLDSYRLSNFSFKNNV